MAIRSLRLCLCGMGLALGLAAAPARAQEFHLGTVVDRTGSGIVHYDISLAPSQSHFTVVGSFNKGMTKVSGLTFQGQPVPMFQLGVASPAKPVVSGTTDARGAAKGQVALPAGVVQRLKGSPVYFQAFAIHSPSGSQKPRVVANVSNVVMETGR